MTFESDNAKKAGLEVLFLGSGNAFAAQGRSYNAFVVNERYLFDAGPTIMPQMRKAQLDPNEIDAVFISHFHADHFFGLPFLLLEFWRTQRRKDLYIVGPPGIEERTEHLMELGFPAMPEREFGYQRRYVEVSDGFGAQLPGVEFTVAEVDHVPALQCYGYAARIGGRTFMYSGDSKFCPGLLTLAKAADVLVLDCNCGGDPVHLGIDAVDHVRSQANPGAHTILGHLDGSPQLGEQPNILAATDLARFCL